MAYYAGIVSLLELLEQINNPEHPYSKSLLGKHQIVSLYEKLTCLHELLEKYSPKLVKEAAGNCLGRRIRDATYHAQDIIESYISDWVPRQLLVEGLEELTPDNIVGKKLVEDLEKVKEEVDSIVKDLMRTHGDEYLTAIKAQLRGGSSRLEVISIVGMGGLGKTTWARNIFNDKQIGDYFDCRAWVTISQNYNMRNILLAIINSLNISKEELLGAEEQNLKVCIYQHLFGRRYLIIMDDMWDTEVWDDIKRILPDDSNGSRVIITTRLSDVAVYTDRLGFTHRMQFLNEDQSWNLFYAKVFCPLELEDIGRLIANHCRGLPLAIVVVAGLLSKVNKTRHDWGEIARCLESTAISENDEHLSNILSLSYNQLPHHLKPCLLYFGGFPEDCEIHVSTLIKLWVAEGFLRPRGSKSLEEVGEECVRDLVSRNLVLTTKMGSDGQLKCCCIHDLLRDLCLLRAHSENFLHVYPESTWNMRRLFVHSHFSFQNYTLEKNGSLVSSIILFRDSWDHSFSVVSCLKLLRVLDIRKMGISSFPDQIVALLHLRYLALPRSILRIPPSIFKLQNLQTLVVDGGTSLPSEIWKMPHLRHIMIGDFTLPPIPYSGRTFDGVPLLGMLQTLYTVRDFTFTRDIVKMIPSLRKLKVSYSFNAGEMGQKICFNDLVYLRELETLRIQFELSYQCFSVSLPESFAFPATLKKLTLEGCMFPWKDMRVVGSLPNLQVLKLRWDSFVGEEWEPIEGEFPKLKLLLMERLSDLKYWPAESIDFPCLEHLQIINCQELEEIPSQIGDIPTLQLIEVCGSRVIVDSALRIQEEQRDMGNDALEVRLLDPNYFW